MQSVLFACGTEYHLLMASILATTTYAKSPKILLLYATNRTRPYLERARASGIWDEVILIEPEAPAATYEPLWSDLLIRASALHTFTWGFPHFNTLMARSHAAGVPVILTDEGLLTYSPRRRFSDWLAHKHDGAFLAQDFSFEAISEIWLLEPALLLEPPDCPVRQIDLPAFVAACRAEAEWGARFRRLFDLSPTMVLKAEAVLFRQYFPLLEVLPPEIDAWLDSAICAVFQPVGLAIKNHPAWVNPLLRDAGNNFPGADRPWEALVLLGQMGPEVETPLPRAYVGLTSSAMVKTALLGVEGTYLFLHRLMARYTGWQDTTVDEVMERLSQIVPRARFFAPADWGELRTVLADLGRRENWALNLEALPTPADESALWREVSLTYWRQSREQARRWQALEREAQDLRAQVEQKEAVLREVIRLMHLTADILRKELGE
ncbi:hypothetical protein [uncultured Thermanaerothrix sp.]|uniref:hypothetical protein n=1 Tax=uncultured Thermanaerothrix sp. TaxID=1195149 RepID=UPI0026100FBA|nr:hypothetical protein [uncultured Thermanaerothrix sp.]